jgi:hypothetical protein
MLNPYRLDGPADVLRARLTHGRGRLLVVLATFGAWLMDMLLVQHLKHRQLIAPDLNPVVHAVDLISTLVFIIVTIGLSLSLFRHRNRALHLQCQQVFHR